MHTRPRRTVYRPQSDPAGCLSPVRGRFQAPSDYRDYYLDAGESDMLAQVKRVLHLDIATSVFSVACTQSTPSGVWKRYRTGAVVR